MINNYRRKVELKDDMYIRTSYGKIDKILELNDSYVKGVSQKDDFYVYDIDNITKVSYDIIDLISRFDLVNGHLVICKMYEDEKDIPTIIKCVGDYYFKEEDIKSVITHEQMERMAYKVEE